MMEERILKARENLLSDGYGKFDLVEELFNREALMTKKPRVLRQEICNLLQLELEKINYQTFQSWLSRYRKNASKQPVATGVVNNETNQEGDDWRNFQATEPIRGLSNSTDILKQVK